MTDAATTDATTTATTDEGEPRELAGVLFLGDSLTEHGSWGEAFPDLQVVNSGRSGDTTTDVLERLDEVVQAGPAAVVLMAGTNDLHRRATVEQVVRGLENILVTLHRELPVTRLIVQSVLPREPERAEFVHQTNIHLRQFAPTVKAEYLDLWPEFADDDGALKTEYTDDRLHLNAAGYSAWADQLRPLLLGPVE